MKPNNSIPLDFRRHSPEEMLSRADGYYQLMRRRRSVRDFSPDEVPCQLIEQCLLTAGTAASGANCQPWHFAVVQNPELKQQIRLEAEKEERAFYEQRAPQAWLDDLAPLGTDANKPFLVTAPYLIGVFQQRFGTSSSGEKQKHYYATESVGLATGLLISALHQAGLACLTHTPSPMKFLNQLMGRPKSERPFLLLVVGYPAPDAVVPDISKKTLDEISSFL
ncbi:MAG: nitroreductase [Candidatus Azotimanducaceae bacterium]|jgi:nitroreductase